MPKNLPAPAIRDHPRMRGEHVKHLIKDGSVWGSSPHARGTHAKHADILLDEGIIPACAGNTVSVSEYLAQAGDHPRMRGEHAASELTNSQSKGSSPHARGTPDQHARGRGRQGIIPACAGNTKVLFRPSKDFWDHPRMRGEHRTLPSCRIEGTGSSPHARGTHAILSGGIVAFGIIPACAGNTGSSRLIGVLVRDHPRMRGEHELTSSLVRFF